MTRRLFFQQVLHRSVGEGASSFLGLLHFTLDLHLIVLSAKQGSYQVPFSESWIYIYIYIYIWMFVYIYQPFRTRRMWHKANFSPEFNRFEFRVFPLQMVTISRLKYQVCSTILPIAGGRLRFLPFPSVLALCEMQTYTGFEIGSLCPFPTTVTGTR